MSHPSRDSYSPAKFTLASGQFLQTKIILNLAVSAFLGSGFPPPFGVGQPAGWLVAINCLRIEELLKVAARRSPELTELPKKNNRVAWPAASCGAKKPSFSERIPFWIPEEFLIHDSKS